MAAIINPAIRLPRAIIRNDFFLSKSKRTETKLPDQTPVPGKGMATNIKSPQ